MKIKMEKNMRKHILLLLILGLSCISITAQKIKKPSLTPVPATVLQQRLIEEGIKFHDQGQFNKAIESYQKVLKENPDSTIAIYELALSYYALKDYDKTKETAFRLIQYKGKEGVLGYGLFANALDDQGKPDDAVKIYEKAIKQFKGDPEYDNHLSGLYYNLGVTYTRQKKYVEAKEALKNSILENFQYASPNYLLGEIYIGTSYKIPAFLAASRLITLETNTPRSARASAVILEVLKPAEKNDKGGYTITLDLFAKKDEGDFGTVELFLGTLNAIEKDENKNKSKNEIFADSVGTLIALVAEAKDIKSTFVGKTYVPFMIELKKKGYVKHFAYLVLQQSGNKEAEEWLIKEGKTTIEFFDWIKKYELKK